MWAVVPSEPLCLHTQSLATAISLIPPPPKQGTSPLTCITFTIFPVSQSLQSPRIFQLFWFQYIFLPTVVSSQTTQNDVTTTTIPQHGQNNNVLPIKKQQDRVRLILYYKTGLSSRRTIPEQFGNIRIKKCKILMKDCW
eukprot:TRINITY_DN17511_c0_g1_i8.p1 TRINITY_DN17511_c0_g1~~TRINITY_DN17511_c0_g1_i8.p1  ORF type:complete len:139 (+),score=4.65 TRINITY_DN17511_c0_g1_i8:82-498(+)